MLQSIFYMHIITQESLSDQKYVKNIRLGSEIEASIRTSFSTVLPSILVGNNKETTGGTYECLVGCIKEYPI